MIAEPDYLMENIVRENGAETEKDVDYLTIEEKHYADLDHSDPESAGSNHKENPLLEKFKPS